MVGIEGAWCAGVYGIWKLKTIRNGFWCSEEDVDTILVLGLSATIQGYLIEWVQPRIDH